MIFLTDEECQEFCNGYGLTGPLLDAGARSWHRHRVGYPKEGYQYFGLSQQLSSLCFSSGNNLDSCLLWVTNPCIWPSSNNLHLYYRLRQSYGDARLIAQAPGHQFLEHEEVDLASYLQLGMLFGWDMKVLCSNNFAHLLFSHDEFVDIVVEEESSLANIVKELEGS